MSDTTRKRLAAALAAAAGPPAARRHPRREAFLRAAAVLWRFDPKALQPDAHKRATDGECVAMLGDAAVGVRVRDGARVAAAWTLRDELRREVLAKMRPADLARARKRNANVTGPEQALVDRWLTDADADLDGYDLEQLAVVQRVSAWFEPPRRHFPSADRLERARARAAFRAPLHNLVGAHFAGRAMELAAIRDFVLAASASGPALLVLHGVGGVGKSTLAAKFLLDAIAAADPTHVVAYLDFDQPRLDIGEGVSLLLEMAAQGAAQRPDARGLREVAARAAAATADLAAGRGGAPGRSIAVRASTQELAQAYGDALRQLGVARMTLVLDTFEEIQYANADHVVLLEEQLAVLAHHVPSLHTLIVSRARIALPGVAHLEVGDLDAASARAYLAARKVLAEDAVEAALLLAGGNPLSLKLAAELVHRLGPDGLAGLDVRGSLEQELVQGQLYQRILRHVHHAEVQRLAHPGLVVRRITAEIIREVLAVPCGLGPIDARQADALVGQLAREVSLVRVAGDGALEHRPDVRRVMLRLLYQDRPHLARELHARAASFYAKRADETAIAEEAYHRFALGETTGQWLTRLTPEAAARLRGALEELPESCWPVLASYAGIDLPPELMQRAHEADVERGLAKRLESMLSRDRGEQALQTLASEKELEPAIDALAQAPPRRPSSPLWRWQGRAFALIGRPREALAALERSLASLLGPDSALARDRWLALEMAKKLDDRAAIERLEAMQPPPPPAVRPPPPGSGLSGMPAAGPPPGAGLSAGKPRPLAAGSPGSHAAPVTQVAARAPGAGLQPDADLITWLDDQELRLLVGQTIELHQRDLVTLELEPRSTRAAQLYAQAVQLNRAPSTEDGSVPLVSWARRVHGSPYDSVATLKASLKTLLK